MRCSTRGIIGHGYVIVNTQSNTKAIKAGAEIGSARWNANRDLLHRSAVAHRARDEALRCGSVAGPHRAATDPLCAADSQVCLKSHKRRRKNEFGMDRCKLASRFRG